jgi:hypothetical protein
MDCRYPADSSRFLLDGIGMGENLLFGGTIRRGGRDCFTLAIRTPEHIRDTDCGGRHTRAAAGQQLTASLDHGIPAANAFVQPGNGCLFHSHRIGFGPEMAGAYLRRRTGPDGCRIAASIQRCSRRYGIKAKWRDDDATPSDGETWIVHQPPPSSLNFESSITSLRAAMGTAFYAKVKNQPLQLRGTLYFTLYGNRHSTLLPLNSSPIPVNRIGICSADPRFLLCNSAFRPRSDLVAIRTFQDSPSGPKETPENLTGIAPYSPFPADLNVNPVSRFFSPRTQAISAARVEALQPLAHLERSFEIDHLRLNDFVTLQ